MDPVPTMSDNLENVVPFFMRNNISPSVRKKERKKKEVNWIGQSDDGKTKVT